MMRRIGAILLTGILLTGCQSGGTGVQVEVRAEPKTGYKPPADEFSGSYGSTVDVGATPHDHTYHLIDYRRLEGIVVWLKPAAPVGGEPEPIDAKVNVTRGKPVRLEDFALASVGGQVTIGPPGNYVLRSESGQLLEISANQPKFNATTAGFVEILSDDSDEPVGAFYVAPASWAKKVRSGDRPTFTPLPEGIYVVGAWHPILPGSEARVQVSTQKLSKVSLKVGVNSLPKPGR
jgi:hypothetical protein